MAKAAAAAAAADVSGVEQPVRHKSRTIILGHLILGVYWRAHRMFAFPRFVFAEQMRAFCFDRSALNTTHSQTFDCWLLAFRRRVFPFTEFYRNLGPGKRVLYRFVITRHGN